MTGNLGITLVFGQTSLFARTKYRLSCPYTVGHGGFSRLRPNSDKRANLHLTSSAGKIIRWE